MTDATYFIYLHTRNDTGDVFYVGKGTRTHAKQYQRAFVTKRRSKFWQAIDGKAGFTVHLYADFFQESDAFDMERELIAHYKRVRDGGTLCNLTLGGEGHAGLAPSPETRAKLSAASSGSKHFNWGRKLSAETCRKKSETLRASPKNLRGKKLPDWWKERIAAGKMGALNPFYGKRTPIARKVVGKGVEYASVSDAAAALGLKMKTLYNMLSGHRPNRTDLRFA